MNVAGIIAEYNPFHNGHRYQLDTLREKTGADYVVIAMSGNFVQRGVPAFFDKFERAKAALCCGADLVLEIPTVWATASAEYFASAGVSLLGSTGVVQHLGYGVESHTPDLMKEIISLLQDSPQVFHELIMKHQKQGNSYPVSRFFALCQLLPHFSESEVKAFLSSPNNILALEYEKALAKWNKNSINPITSHPILRLGAGYHEDTLTDGFSSATAIRKAWMEQTSIENVAAYIPLECQKIYRPLLEERHFVSEDEISSLLYYKLLSNATIGYESYADCSASLSHKIQKNLTKYKNFSQFCSLLKSKDLTYTRICRVLTHILLDIRQIDYKNAYNGCKIPYIRILGFREQSEDLLKSIKKMANAPLIAKMADAPNILTPETYQVLEKDIFSGDLYYHLHHFSAPMNEISHPIIKINV